jgi:acyl transferase domain-containing protein
VGALAEVLAAAGTAASRQLPTHLAAAKSRYGHGETAAGALGMLRCAAMLAQRACPPLLYLRSLNGYVASALGQGGWGGAAIARQAAPAGRVAAVAAAAAAHAGCSAFAFQGTNAHVVLSAAPAPEARGFAELAASGAAAAAAGGSAGLVWRSRRFWYQPPPHFLLASVAADLGAVGTMRRALWAAFEVAVGRPALAFLWQHQVRVVYWLQR